MKQRCELCNRKVTIWQRYCRACKAVLNTPVVWTPKRPSDLPPPRRNRIET